MHVWCRVKWRLDDRLLYKPVKRALFVILVFKCHCLNLYYMLMMSFLYTVLLPHNPTIFHTIQNTCRQSYNFFFKSNHFFSYIKSLQARLRELWITPNTFLIFLKSKVRFYFTFLPFILILFLFERCSSFFLSFSMVTSCNISSRLADEILFNFYIVPFFSLVHIDKEHHRILPLFQSSIFVPWLYLINSCFSLYHFINSLG